MHKKIISIMVFAVLHFPFCVPVSADEIFRVGVILPLSGPAADYGAAVKKGMEFAQADFPELFRKIEFIFEDGAFDSRQALSAYKKLTSLSPRVDILYVWGVTYNKALSPLAESQKIPLIQQCTDQTSAAGKKYIIRFMNDGNEFMERLLSFIRKQGWKKLGFVLSENAYLEENFHALQSKLKDGESVEIAERYLISDMEFRSGIARLRKGYDAVGVFLAAGQAAHFLRTARNQGIGLPFFGTNYFDSPTEIQASQGGMEGAYYVSSHAPKFFIERLKSSGGIGGQVGYATLAYEFTAHLGETLKGLGSKPNAEDFLGAFLAKKEIQGKLLGRYILIDDPQSGRYFQFPLAVKQIQKGSAVEIEAGMGP